MAVVISLYLVLACTYIHSRQKKTISFFKTGGEFWKDDRSGQIIAEAFGDGVSCAALLPDDTYVGHSGGLQRVA